MIFNHRQQNGFSLVELMVAIAIGITMTGVTLQIFVDHKQTARVIEANSRLQENARFALEFLVSDIRKAGFSNNCNSTASMTNHLDTSDPAYDPAIHSMDVVISGSDGTTDSITLYNADVSATGVTVETPYMNTNAANVKVSTPNSFNAGDIVMIGDCSSAEIFQISSGNPEINGVVVHNSGGAQPPGNSTSNFSKTYDGNAQVFSISSDATTYSIATGENGQNALFVSENGAAAEELVEGIENMQILYGADTDGDKVPNYYVPSSSATMSEIVAVKISLLVQSIETGITLNAQSVSYNGLTVTATNGRLLRVFNTTIQIRNRVL